MGQVSHVPILAIGEHRYEEKHVPFLAVHSGSDSDPRTVVLMIEGTSVLVHADDLIRAVNLARTP